MSFKMSKDLAHRIAKSMLAKKGKEVNKLYKDFQQAVTDEYEAQVPDVVKKLMVEAIQYITFTSSISVAGFGFKNYHYVDLIKSIPCKSSGYDKGLKMTAELGTKLKALLTKYEVEKTKYDNLLSEIEVALFGLSSYNRIKEEFPEAIEYLPTTQSRALMINIDDIRKKIKTA